MLEAAFTLWSSPVTWLEIAAFAASLAMVWCNLRVIHWAWPLAIAASLMYGVLFAHSKLYGEASLQIFFVCMSLWGWWLWWLGRADAITQVAGLSARARWQALAAGAACVLVIGLFLSQATDSTVPWLDAIPTGLSLVGQWLLARKRTENWAVWLVVNLFSCVLFAYKSLWLTVLLYALFAALSVLGWMAWRRMERAQSGHAFP